MYGGLIPNSREVEATRVTIPRSEYMKRGLPLVESYQPSEGRSTRTHLGGKVLSAVSQTQKDEHRMAHVHGVPGLHGL